MAPSLSPTHTPHSLRLPPFPPPSLPALASACLRPVPLVPAVRFPAFVPTSRRTSTIAKRGAEIDSRNHKHVLRALCTGNGEERHRRPRALPNLGETSVRAVDSLLVPLGPWAPTWACTCTCREQLVLWPARCTACTVHGLHALPCPGAKPRSFAATVIYGSVLKVILEEPSITNDPAAGFLSPRHCASGYLATPYPARGQGTALVRQLRGL